MNKELDRLKHELELQEKALVSEKENTAVIHRDHLLGLEKHKAKWVQKTSTLNGEIAKIQSSYNNEHKSYQIEIDRLNTEISAMQDSVLSAEQDDLKFLTSIDSELTALLNLTITKPSIPSLNPLDDTITDELEEDSIKDYMSSTLTQICQSKELLSRLLMNYNGKQLQKQGQIVQKNRSTLPDVSKLNKDTSVYSKVLFNEEVMNSLTMSEREALVYSIINKGQLKDQNQDVKIEDLLRINNEQASRSIMTSLMKVEDMSKFLEGNEEVVDVLKHNEDDSFQIQMQVSQTEESKRLAISPISTQKSESEADYISELSGSVIQAESSLDPEESRDGLLESFKIRSINSEDSL